MSAVVVFSPSRFSLYTLCVTELLVRQHIDVRAVVVRRLFDRKRFAAEFGRDGSRLLEKIWKKLILRERAYRHKEYETIASFMRHERITARNVGALGRTHGIPVVYCNDLNDTVVAETLENEQPDLVVFTGGGLIRRHILERAGAGILNCHMGVLPKYRGMDVVEWPVLEGEPGQVGMSVHFMDDGLDTGDILRVTNVAVAPRETFAQLRDRFEPEMCRQIVGSCVEYLKGDAERIPQQPAEGKQYFIMHRRLMEVAEAKLRRHGTSSSTPEA